MKFPIVIISAALLFTLSCKAKKAATNECATFLVSYESQVKPILDANCATSCHSAANHAAGIDLSTYESVKAVSARNSFLGAVKHSAGFSPMPKKAAQLSAEDIKTLSCWVSNGSPK